MDIFLGYSLSLLTVFCTIGIITALQKIFKFSGELSRKLIHIFVGLTWIPMYIYLKGSIHFIIVPCIFVVVNALSNKFRLFKAMERETEKGKSDFGTVYFALCMTVMSCLSYFFDSLLLPYGIAVATLCLGDGAAAIFGKYIKKNNPTLISGKSLFGTIACFVFSCIGVFVFGLFFKEAAFRLWQVLVIGFFAAVLELFGKKIDNFAVSFGTMFISALFLGVF